MLEIFILLSSIISYGLTAQNSFISLNKRLKYVPYVSIECIQCKNILAHNSC